MAPNPRLRSTPPRVRGLFALAFAAMALSLALTVAHKPERDGWLPLPPQPMDGSDYDIRQLLSKSAQAANPSAHADGPPGLAALCGQANAQTATPPPGARKRPRPVSAPRPRGEDWAPVPLTDERYLLWFADAHGPERVVRQVRIDVHGERARVRVRAGVGDSALMPPATVPRGEPWPESLDRLDRVRDAWSAPELWSAPQRSAVSCAQRFEVREAFFEACVNGRYFARDRSCDRGAAPHLDRLWQVVRDTLPAPVAAAAPSASLQP